MLGLSLFTTGARVVALGLTLAISLSASAATSVRSINLQTNGIAANPATGQVVATAGSSVGTAFGNRLIVMDPLSASIVDSVFVGSEPGRVAVASDGSRAYVGINGAGAARIVDLPTLTAGTQFVLPLRFGPTRAEDIAVSPTDPTTVLISAASSGVSPRHAGVFAYTNGVELPDSAPDHTGSNRIEFGSDGHLYGYNNETTGFDFYKHEVDANGVRRVDSAARLISGFSLDFSAGGTTAVSTSGVVIDMPNLTVLGRIGTQGPTAVHPSLPRVFVLTNQAIDVYDLDTFLLTGTIDVPGFSSGSDLIYTGGDGLAFRSGSSVVFVNDALVPEPASLAILLGGISILTGRRRSRHTA